MIRPLASLLCIFGLVAPAPAQPTNPASETTYTLAQVLGAQEDNWNRLNSVQYMAVRRRLGPVNAASTPTPQTRPAPAPGPGPGRTTPPGNPTEKGAPSSPEAANIAISKVPSAPPDYFPLWPLPDSPEVTISGLFDLSTRRGAAIALPGRAAIAYRRGLGPMVWSQGANACYVDGVAGKLLTILGTAAGSGQRGHVGLSESSLPQGAPSAIAPPSATAQMLFHPRHLTDVPALLAAWENRIPVTLRRIDPTRIVATWRIEETEWTTLLSENSSMLPESVQSVRNGQVIEARQLLLRQVGGVWLGARAVINHANGRSEAWHYDHYSANQPLGTRGVTIEFLRLPPNTPVPDWAQPFRLEPPVPTQTTTP